MSAMASRLGSSLQDLGSGNWCSNPSINVRPGMRFDVGSRVRVMKGRKFQDFESGDVGTILRLDIEGGVCIVAFDECAEPKQVALRHLELESPKRQLQSTESTMASLGQFRQSSAFQDHACFDHVSSICGATGTESEEERSPHLDGNRQETRPTHELQPPSWQDGKLCADALKFVADVASIEPAWSRGGPEMFSIASPVTPGRVPVHSPLRGATETGQTSNSVDLPNTLMQITDWQEALRKEAAELRRTADAVTSTEHFENSLVGEGPDSLVEAMQASVQTTATATATAMVEVASLRVEVGELHTSIHNESEQRAKNIREVERVLEQFRSKQERLAQKQVELVSICLSSQRDREPHELSAGAHIDWEKWEQRFSALEQGFEATRRSQDRAEEQLRSLQEGSTVAKQEQRKFEEHLTALEVRSDTFNTKLDTLDTLERSHADQRAAHAEMEARLERIETRVIEAEKRLVEVYARAESCAAGLAQKADREASPIAAGRIDALASQIDTLVMDLAVKAERSMPPIAYDSAKAVESLSERVDQLATTLGVQVARVQALHDDGMQEHVASALRAQIESFDQRLSEEVRFRQDAILGLEAKCRQAHDAADAAAWQIAAVLADVRMDAESVQTGRKEELKRRRETELVLQRLRGELDVLREELMRRSAVSPTPSPPGPPTPSPPVTPPLTVDRVHNVELSGSGALRAMAALPAPEAAGTPNR